MPPFCPSNAMWSISMAVSPVVFAVPLLYSELYVGYRPGLLGPYIPARKAADATVQRNEVPACCCRVAMYSPALPGGPAAVTSLAAPVAVRRTPGGIGSSWLMT